MKQLFYGVGAALCGALLLLSSADAQAAPGIPSGHGVPYAQHHAYLLQADYWGSYGERDYRYAGGDNHYGGRVYGYGGRDYRCRKVWLDDGEWELRCRKRQYPKRYSCEESRGWNGDWKLRCHRRNTYGWRQHYDD